MDFAQALLCLVTFNSPAKNDDVTQKNLSACEHEEVSVQPQRLEGKFNLDFHMLPLEKDGALMTTAAGHGFSF